MSLIYRAFGDAQTTITSLAAGVGGTASSAAGDYVISLAGGKNDGGVGALGLQFCARAVISAAAFGTLSYLMPETSGNVFFSILFFAADRGLMSSALGLSSAAVGALRQMGPPMQSGGPPSRYTPGPMMQKAGASCTSCK